MLNEKVTPEYFNTDCGLGYCLQCIAEYKIAGMDPAKFPRWACMSAPITGMNSSAGTCFIHLNVQPPQQPLRPEEAQAVQRLAMPNGQPMNPRHAR
jgi:hypothetical protein